MGPLIYLTLAFAAFWLIAFILIVTIFSRQRNLQREVDVLEQIVDRSQSETSS